MKVSIKLITFLLLLSPCLNAEDFGIAMPDQLNEPDSELNSKPEESISTVPGYSEEMDASDFKESHTLMDSVEDNHGELPLRSRLLRADAAEPYEFESRDQLVTIKENEIAKDIYNKGTYLFSFAYILDQFDATDPNGIFQRTYEQSTGSTRGGSLHFELDKIAYQGFMRFTYGFSFGFGLSQGKASFETSPGTQSNASFSLYTIPVDLRLGLDLINMRNFKVSLAGGPSVMGLYQSRSDKEEGEDGKRVRQYSFGYFAQAKLKLGLGLISDKKVVSNFNTYKMTNMSLNLETRFQSYENFQDPFSLTGASVGLGFSFEYL